MGRYQATRRVSMATAETKIHVSEFTNEPFTDFFKPENRSAMEAALNKVAAEFGKEYPMYIGGQKVVTTAKMTSANPSHPSSDIAVFQSKTADLANQAIEAASKAFESSYGVPAGPTAECLLGSAKHLLS